MRLPTYLQGVRGLIPLQASRFGRWLAGDPTDAAIWQISVAARTDIGRVRKRNEDSLFAEAPEAAEVQRQGWLAAVADGVGGRPAGDVASGLAVQTLRQSFYRGSNDRGSTRQPGARLRTAVDRANTAIFARAQAGSDYAGMATTLTAALVLGPRLIVAHVGDSRAYLFRDGRLTRLTRDHSVVEELVRAGQITAEQARTHKRRNVVTRVLGQNDHVDVDIVEMRVQTADVLLLCTDGLHGVVDEAAMGLELEAGPEVAADALVRLANAQGGRDNVSVIVARLTATVT